MSCFNTIQIVSDSYEKVLLLLINLRSKALNGHSKALNGHSKALNGHSKALNRDLSSAKIQFKRA